MSESPVVNERVNQVSVIGLIRVGLSLGFVTGVRHRPIDLFVPIIFRRKMGSN